MVKGIGLAPLCWVLGHGYGAAGAALDPPGRQTLPAEVTPAAYHLVVTPDARGLSFRGAVDIDIDVHVKLNRIVLNAEELTIDLVRLEHHREARSVKLDADAQTMAVQFATAIAVGRHVLHIEYHGALGHSTLGFFAMDYPTPRGLERMLATNFEPAAERRFMPSWDEPGRKAALSLAVKIPRAQSAVSNMPVVASTPLAGGLKQVQFATTPRMSTYLYFLAVGDLERAHLRVDGVDVGVVTKRGDIDRARYALKVAAQVLHFYNGYFRLRYPLPKLDLIVAPGAIEGENMENWGSMLFSQEYALLDLERSDADDRRRIYSAVAHEMAHQWFGDLVTMQWWNDLWLNEGFASWMSTKARQRFHPEWEPWLLQAQAEKERALRLDAKLNTHAVVQSIRTVAEAEAAFDDITYAKAQTTIAMLESFVGAATFRAAVRGYLSAHAYQTTTSDDFWGEVQRASGRAVLAVAHDLTQQAGVPLIRVEAEASGVSGTRVRICEDRFVEDHGAADPTAWRLPVALRARGQPTLVIGLLEGGRPRDWMVPGKAPVLVNAGQIAYGRTIYARDIMAQITTGFGALAATEQIAILSDTWASGESGYAPISDYFALLLALPPDAESAVWLRVVPTLVSIGRLYDDLPGAPAFRAFVRARLEPIGRSLGWEPPAGEPDRLAWLRAETLSALARFGDEQVITEARRRFEDLRKGTSTMSSEIERICVAIVAQNANEDGYGQILDLIGSSRDTLQRQRLMEALAGALDPILAERTLAWLLTQDVVTGSRTTLLMQIATEHPDLAWTFVTSHADQPDFPFTASEQRKLAPAIAGLARHLERIVELRSYAAGHFTNAAQRDVETAVSSIHLNAEVRAARLPALDQWIAVPHLP